MTASRIGKDRTALITGASSGIGEELARCFAEGGFNLVLVARRADRLQALADMLSAQHGVQTWVAAADLAQRGSAAKLAGEMKRGKRAIDVLVNCASVLEHGQFVSMAADRHRQLIEVNVSALTAMLAHFLPPMLARGYGRILNVASIAAFQPVPSLATYAATKAYVLSLTESLAEELRDTGVTVSALCPGITATPMMHAVQQASQALQLPGIVVGDARSVAIEGYNACLNGEVISVPGGLNLASTLLSRAAPKWLVRRLGGFFGRAMTKA